VFAINKPAKHSTSIKTIHTVIAFARKESCFYGYHNSGDRRSIGTSVSSSLVSIAWGLMNIKSYPIFTSEK